VYVSVVQYRVGYHNAVLATTPEEVTCNIDSSFDESRYYILRVHANVQ
jgi:hypothetical protein